MFFLGFVMFRLYRVGKEELRHVWSNRRLTVGDVETDSSDETGKSVTQVFTSGPFSDCIPIHPLPLLMGSRKRRTYRTETLHRRCSRGSQGLSLTRIQRKMIN